MKNNIYFDLIGGSAPIRIGVDIGGTKLEAIALDPGGTTRARRRVATPGGDYEGTVRAVADLVRAVESEAGGSGPVGVGIPGSVSRTNGLVKGANSTCLNGRPLDRDVAAAIGRPVRLANDANCFALSEASDGAAAGRHVVFGAILGTGVGGGIVIDGRVLDGANGIAGEWGHTPLPAPDDKDGPVCWCGRASCIEAYLSGPALAADHARRHGGTRSARDLAAAAAEGDAASRGTIERHARRLARALAQIINVLDPDVIVLGGGLSQIASLYARVPALWEPHVFSDAVTTPLLPPKHGDSSGVRGAARLWPEALP
ncbi:MAG: ROK family protein [Alphaproteobacteria bacterium]|nr:ROK family protein [Alphaproteobacteria bacterium]